jgi:N-acetylmuramic acid 6-phosphate etherase
MSADQEQPPAPTPDASPLATEAANANSAEIDRMSPLEIARVMNAEDATVASAVERELPQIAAAIEAIAAYLRNSGRLVYVGAGTSGRLGALDAAECPPTFNAPPETIVACVAGGPSALTRSAEDQEDDADAGAAAVASLAIAPSDVVVGITASGRTPYVLGAVSRAKAAGALVVGLACNSDTPLASLADIMIAPLVGPEVIAGSTRLKAGTAQKMVLNMLSTGAMILLGKTYGNLMVDVQATNTKLHARALEIVHRVTGAPRAEAAEVLAAASGETKTAIMMVRAGVAPDDARSRLARHRGNLRAALDESI